VAAAAPSSAVLCCAVLCCAVLCCAVLCCAVLAAIFDLLLLHCDRRGHNLFFFSGVWCAGSDGGDFDLLFSQCDRHDALCAQLRLLPVLLCAGCAGCVF
jgi:hypothetical protein